MKNKTIEEIISYLENVEFDNYEIYELKDLFKTINTKKIQLTNAIVRKLFIDFVGKNLLIKYKNDSEIIVICRGVTCWIYDITSTHVDPKKISYDDLREMILNSEEVFGDIDKITILPESDAVEYIRNIYMQRANKSKEFLKQLLNWEG